MAYGLLPLVPLIPPTSLRYSEKVCDDVIVRKEGSIQVLVSCALLSNTQSCTLKCPLP